MVAVPWEGGDAPDSRRPTPDARYLSCGKLPLGDLKYAKGVLRIMFETRDM